jgi:hypothetical protein
MWSKRTFGASGYAEAQEDGVEPAHSNCACPSHARSNCADSNRPSADRARSSRVRVTSTNQYAHNRRHEE